MIFKTLSSRDFPTCGGFFTFIPRVEDNCNVEVFYGGFDFNLIDVDCGGFSKFVQAEDNSLKIIQILF